MDTISEIVKTALIEAARDAYGPDRRIVATCPTCGYGFYQGEEQRCNEDCE